MIAPARTAPVAASVVSPLAAQMVARVMICDDSAVIRGAISRMLEAEPGIQVVAKVANGQQAIDELKRTKTDVLVLDIEMPVMDGLSALPLLLKVDPGLRIVMSSTLTTHGAEVAMRALRLGAADYVPKPSSLRDTNDDSFRRDLVSKIKGLARLRNRTAVPVPVRPPAVARAAPVLAPKLLAIGSSTGGPQALFTLVPALGKSLPVPVILTQHMPATFTPILAEHITRLGGMPCAEAKDGEALANGRIYLAPGDKHLIVELDGGTYRARLSTDPPENFCRPSVDPMLRSAVRASGGRVLVAMLTGMGQDGLAGTRLAVEQGGVALAQDEATSVVWGMPGAIALAGLCHAVLPLPRIASRILELLRVPVR